MNPISRVVLSAVLGALLAQGARAALVVPGADGTDGALNITSDTVIDLSQAVTASWDTGNSANSGRGVYDAQKWAVVFKYTDVNIAAGATVRFKNHASRAPVVWLVSGNVTIDGNLVLTGENWRPAPQLSEPGPGGFRGGRAASFYGAGQQSSGFGPGGGADFTQYDGYAYEGSGSYATRGTRGSDPYGNPSLLPLIGGSGGAGHWGGSYGGAAGGGAILIAVQNQLTLRGFINADGGTGAGGTTGGHGSGGGVRLIAARLSGSGSGIRAAAFGDAQSKGGDGRIRVERVANDATFSVAPDPSVIDLQENATAILWPPTGAPEVRVLSVGGVNTPADPRAEFGTFGPDIALPQVSQTQVLVETRYVEQASQVKVRVTPRSNGNFTEVAATVDSVVTTDPLVIRWRADLPVNIGYSAVQVKVVRP